MIIKEWKKAWKFLSVQAMGIGVAMSSTYAMMYEQMKDTIDPKTMATITCVVFFLGIIGRLKTQGEDVNS